jgi:hypothetical protein
MMGSMSDRVCLTILRTPEFWILRSLLGGAKDLAVVLVCIMMVMPENEIGICACL